MDKPTPTVSSHTCHDAAKSPQDYGLVRIEAIRATLVGLAVIGAIALGFRYPDQYAQAASVTLSAVAGGYFGIAQARLRE